MKQSYIRRVNVLNYTQLTLEHDTKNLPETPSFKLLQNNIIIFSSLNWVSWMWKEDSYSYENCRHVFLCKSSGNYSNFEAGVRQRTFSLYL